MWCMNSAEGATRRRCRLLQKINPTMISVRRTSPPITPPAIAPAFLLEFDACPTLGLGLSRVLLVWEAIIVDVCTTDCGGLSSVVVEAGGSPDWLVPDDIEAI